MSTINIVVCGLQFLLFVLSPISALVFPPISALQCLQCDHVPEARDCTQLTTCSANERCFVQRLIGTNLKQYYKLGCTEANVCNQQISIMGKRSAPQSKPRDKVSHDSGVNSRDLSEREASGDMVLCLQCCDNADGCNKDLCGSPPTTNLRCLSCGDVLDPKHCDQIQECSRNKFCYVHKGLIQHNANYDTRYEMGCLSELQCSAFKYANPQSCVVCCNQTDFCNYGACDNWQPPTSVTTPSAKDVTTMMPVPSHPTTTTTSQPTTTTLAPRVVISGPARGDFNANVTLQCVTVPPAQSSEWKINASSSLPPGVMFATHSRVGGTVAGINTLTISNLNESTMGEYTCIATTNGHVIQATQFIDIIPAPPTVTIQKGLTTNVFTLKCIVGGYPRPTIVWDFKPNAIGAHGLPPGLEFNDDGRESVIFVGSYRPIDHDGDWSCAATNSLGTAIGTITIP